MSGNYSHASPELNAWVGGKTSKGSPSALLCQVDGCHCDMQICGRGNRDKVNGSSDEERGRMEEVKTVRSRLV